jgi:hypothetical protein
MMYSVWDVVNAINEHSEFRISYPADDEQQRPIAESVTYGWDWIKGAVVPFIGN